MYIGVNSLFLSRNSAHSYLFVASFPFQLYALDLKPRLLCIGIFLGSENTQLQDAGSATVSAVSDKIRLDIDIVTIQSIVYFCPWMPLFFQGYIDLE